MDAITAYLADRADRRHLFADDAHVEDDGHTYEGRDQVEGWLDGPASDFTFTTTRVSTEATVVVRLEGDFPGGVVTLRQHFVLDEDGRISSLMIRPA